MAAACQRSARLSASGSAGSQVLAGASPSSARLMSGAQTCPMTARIRVHACEGWRSPCWARMHSCTPSGSRQSCCKFGTAGVTCDQTSPLQSRCCRGPGFTELSSGVSGVKSEQPGCAALQQALGPCQCGRVHPQPSQLRSRGHCWRGDGAMLGRARAYCQCSGSGAPPLASAASAPAAATAPGLRRVAGPPWSCSRALPGQEDPIQVLIPLRY